jgi:hypothetical protein
MLKEMFVMILKFEILYKESNSNLDREEDRASAWDINIDKGTVNY